MLGREREHGQLAGALERDVQQALVGGAGACLATRLDLAALRQVTTQSAQVLVVNFVDLVDAELANLAARCELATGAELTWASSWSGASASRRAC
jgi:hypothetical protein